MTKNRKKKKDGSKCRLLLRKALSVVLVATLSICCWEIGKKQFSYKKSTVVYNKIEQEKNESKNLKVFLSKHDMDWITITNTAINYPLMKTDDNNFYINHNYKGESDIAGAIFYDASDKPYNETATIIYGHSMNNGTMFNNLHYFQQDHERFSESKLIIDTERGKTTYKPLGYYTTTNDIFYRSLDDMLTQDAVNIIKSKSNYFIDTEVKQGAHIIALSTCDYSLGQKGRLIVFYIEE